MKIFPAFLLTAICFPFFAEDIAPYYDTSRSLFVCPPPPRAPDAFAVWRWDDAQQIYVPAPHTATTFTILFRSPANPAFLDAWVIRSDRPYGDSCIEDMYAVVKNDGSLEFRYDVGLLPWRLNRPPASFRAETFPRYTASPPTDSAADVRIAPYGFLRLPSTGHPDDLPFSSGIEFCVTSLPLDEMTASALVFSPLAIRER